MVVLRNGHLHVKVEALVVDAGCNYNVGERQVILVITLQKVVVVLCCYAMLGLPSLA